MAMEGLNLTVNQQQDKQQFEKDYKLSQHVG